MNIRLNYDSSFTTINILGDRIYPNIFSVKLTLITNTEDNTIQNIAFDRVKFMLREIFDCSIISNRDSKHLEFFRQTMPHKIMELPCDAFDQAVGLALFLKLNSIMGDELILAELAISSTIGDSLWYNIDSDDDYTVFLQDQKKDAISWWAREDLQTTNDLAAASGQVTWEDLQLSWDAEENEPEFDVDFQFDPILLDEFRTELLAKEEKKLAIVDEVKAVKQPKK